MKYLITGGTGLIGKKLIASLLADGHEVHNVGRGAGGGTAQPGLHHHRWDGKSIPAGVPPVNVVVNLAGASVGKRWTATHKVLMVRSRVDATRACVEFLNEKPLEGQVFLSASGVNYYGDLVDTPLDESSPKGDSFLSTVCQQWEAAAQGSRARTVCMRIAVVLDPEDGPLAKMLTPYKLFIGGPTGTGRQGFPWIHIDDLVGAIRHLAEHSDFSGAANLVAPQAVRQADFARALGKTLRRPSFFRLPKWVLQLAFGEMSAVLWGGLFVSPNVLKAEKFVWKFPEIGPALQDLLG